MTNLLHSLVVDDASVDYYCIHCLVFIGGPPFLEILRYGGSRQLHEIRGAQDIPGVWIFRGSFARTWVPDNGNCSSLRLYIFESEAENP